MSVFLSTLFSLVEPIGIAVTLVYLYGVTQRRGVGDVQNQLWMGLAFGIAASFGMASSIVVTEGTIVDLRNLFVGIAAAFFGWRGALIALGMAGLTRLGIGGAGAVSGLLGMAIAASMGLTWARFVSHRIRSNGLNLLGLSCMMSLHLFGLVILPANIAVMLLIDLGPQMIMLNILGTLLLGTMIQREQMLGHENQALMSAATIDPLTQALNRNSAVQTFDRLITAKKMARGVAMVCIDLDRFKEVNDTSGHLAGDTVLIEVSRRITSCLRSRDIFARMSGDEFLIVLADVSSDEAQQIAERCRRSVSCAPIEHENKNLQVSISTGTVWSATAKDFVVMRDGADAALYRAKSSGRNCSVFTFGTDRGIRSPELQHSAA